MNKKRPINLDLMTLRFPPMAILSIMHRISGVVLFLLLPLMLYVLQAALASPASYDALCQSVHGSFLGFLVWALLAAAFLHLLAGIRHLLMDAGFGETLRMGRATAYVVFLVWALFIIWMGVRLW